MTPTEIERLDAMVDRYPFLSRSGLVRQAMRLGLDVIDAKGLEVLATKPKRRTKGRRKK